MRLHLLLGALSLPIAMHAAEAKPVPVEREPMHQLVFENDSVRVIDVQIPVGKTTLFHTHVLPSVIVYLTRSTNRSEGWPDRAIQTRDVSPGQSRYAPYDEKPLSHRVTNTGAGLFRVFDIEILKKPAATRPRPPIASPVVRAHWDEKLVRSSSVQLDPGARLDLPSNAYATLLVGISGTIHARSSGAAASTATIAWGDYRFTPAGAGLTLENTAKEKAELVLLELKD